MRASTTRPVPTSAPADPTSSRGSTPCSTRPPRVQPLLVVVEDVHWADQSTRELLTYLFARPFGRPVSLVVVLPQRRRPPAAPAAPTLAEWARLPGPAPAAARSAVRRRRSARWCAPSHPEPLTASRGPGDRRPGRRQRLLHRGARRPAPSLGGRRPARGPRRPAAGASRPARRALPPRGRVPPRSPVGASRTSPARGWPASGADAADLDRRAARRRSTRNILEPRRRGPAVYAFRHALLAEAVYDDLLPGERSRLHAAYVTALRGRQRPGHLGRAGPARPSRQRHRDRDRRQHEAGDEAMRVGAPEEAAQHYQSALELLGPRAAVEVRARGRARPTRSSTPATPTARSRSSPLTWRCCPTPRPWSRAPGCCSPRRSRRSPPRSTSTRAT